MKKLSLTFVLISSTVLSLFCQVQYQTQIMPPLEKAATFNFLRSGPDYEPVLRSLEAPGPGGEGYRAFLQEVKEEVSTLFPVRERITSTRSNLDPPVILESFLGNNTTTNTPLDNHIAVSEGGQVVSVINTHIAVMDMNGSFIRSRTFDNFSLTLNIDNFKFDPKVIYDPQADRFIIIFLSGNQCSTSKVVVAFSETNDASGNWHQYVVDGCPFNNQSFTDYPIIAITENELFLTTNSVLQGEPWQTGFVQTIIWQFDKQDGYAGQPLDRRIWSDITWNGENIWNLCPVKQGEGAPSENIFFLSNRNFVVQNDSIFIVEITHPMDHPDVELNIGVYQTDIPYGVPPHALQPQGMLATNDARILDAFYVNDQIQFVMNTVVPATGRAGFYHGTINNLYTTRDVTGTIISEENTDLGYPSIAYVGRFPEEQDAIIIASHSSADRFPGYSALYFNNEGLHSELVTVKEGEGLINQIPGDVQRWGDYSGNQRKYDEEGKVWVSASFGAPNDKNNTWIGGLLRPDLNVSVPPEPVHNQEVKVFPNPAINTVTLEFRIEEVKENLSIQLVSASGKVVRTFHDDVPRNSGLHAFSFSTAPLPKGVYFIQVYSDGVRIARSKVVVTE